MISSIGLHKTDNNNQVIRLNGVFCVLLNWIRRDNSKWLIIIFAKFQLVRVMYHQQMQTVLL
jgi:hypothetical protein